jgi:hypothetical protein
VEVPFGFDLGGQYLTLLCHVQLGGNIEKDGVTLPAGLIMKFLRQFFCAFHDRVFESL